MLDLRYSTIVIMSNKQAPLPEYKIIFYKGTVSQKRSKKNSIILLITSEWAKRMFSIVR